MKHPIMEFKNIQQAYECLREWQERLFLTDWLIKINLIDTNTIELNEKECSGTIIMTFENKCATMNIVCLTDDARNRIIKVCHEQILIHELLHLKYNWIEPTGAYESKYVDDIEHQLLEQMAKSLLMSKYGLPFEWFKNFKEE